MGKKADSKPAKKDSKKDKKEERSGKDDKRNDKNAKNGKWKKGKSNRSYDTREEIELSNILAQSGLIIHHMEGDGNCMFRSIADQLTEDCDNHMLFRGKIMKYITDHADHFSLFMEDDEKFDVYVERMSECNEWGGHPELYAAAQCFNTNITVYQLDNPTYVIQASECTSKTRNIRLSYHGDCHYNSVRLDPNHLANTAQQTTTATSNTSTVSPVDTSFVFDDDLAVVQGAVPWVDKDKVVTVLQQCKGDVDAAIELLCAEPDTPVTEAATASSVTAMSTSTATNTVAIPGLTEKTVDDSQTDIMAEVSQQINTLCLLDETPIATSTAASNPTDPLSPLGSSSSAAPQIKSAKSTGVVNDTSSTETGAKDMKYRKSGDKHGKPISKKEQRMKDREAARAQARGGAATGNSQEHKPVVPSCSGNGNTIIL